MEADLVGTIAVVVVIFDNNNSNNNNNGCHKRRRRHRRITHQRKYVTLASTRYVTSSGRASSLKGVGEE